MTELKNVHREFELAGNRVAAWLIMNNNASQRGTGNGVFGKIIVRYTKKASIVSILIYATEDGSHNAPAIGATETMTGYGYDRTTLGISTVLGRLRGDLFKWHGFRFNCFDCADCPETPEPGVIRCWNKELERNGYTVIRVL